MSAGNPSGPASVDNSRLRIMRWLILCIGGMILAAAILQNRLSPNEQGSDTRSLLQKTARQEESRIHAMIPVADGFDFPVGPPDAKGYYNAQGFQKNNHLGEDWNGVGGGNTDKGDPVYSIAIGQVASVEDAGPGWGNVVRVLHNVGTLEKPKVIESLYAHLDRMEVHTGQTLKRGQRIGTIGDAHGAYWAHLHFEMRWKPEMPLGGGYSQDTTGFLVPTKYIKAHRGG